MSSRPDPEHEADTRFARLKEHVGHLAPMADHAVRVFTMDGTRYVVKYRRNEPGLLWRAWASALVCFMLFGVFPSPMRLRPGDIHHEARRLHDLREQGVSVPDVYLVTDNHLVTEYCGNSINQVLYTLDPADYEDLFQKLVDDLAQFHRAGHWHGGAQIRNLTLDEHTLYRIDFEENTGTALPLDLAQAYDVLLLFTSLADYFDHNEPLGQQLLARYIAKVDSPAIMRRLTKLECWLTFLMRAEPLLSKRMRNKGDVRRARMFVSILKHGLKPE